MARHAPLLERGVLEMTSGQQLRLARRQRRTGRSANSASLAAHRAFAPLLGLWGALLGGLVVIVLPSWLVERALAGTVIGRLNLPVQPLLAGTCAVLLGLLLYAVAARVHARAAREASADSAADETERQVTPISPLQDLGTRSLDDPLETIPFTPSQVPETDSDVAIARSDPSEKPDHAPAPVELDLAEFAALPTRNAVWVEEPTAAAPGSAAAPEAWPEAPQPDPVTGVEARRLRAVGGTPRAPGSAVLARLRATPTSELSLAEMVERFAGALHEYRETPPSRSLSDADLAAREATLAEALKGLAALSGEGSTAFDHAKAEGPSGADATRFRPQRGAR